MSVKERLVSYLSYKKINKSEFGRVIGVSNAYVSSIRKSIDKDKIQAIALNYPDLNIEWLITGNGSMLKSKENIKFNDSLVSDQAPLYSKITNDIPLIPIDAVAGYGRGDISVLESEIIERYVVPDFITRGVKFLIRVSGDSMCPKYNSGDILGCKPIIDISFFQWGKIYVLDTEQGAIVKRIYEGQNNDFIECRSDNKNYPPFQLPKHSIRSVSIVVGIIGFE
ncbi:hypothetical protein LJB95_00035 [Paludibacteraceae bacterium OttesenSCG-928-F17]|nr:hypothetical protein [Paludibacteraceae bacterium OttesenSCG-928-F17]